MVMDAVLSFLSNYKIVDMCIGVMGIFGFVLIFDRFKALYFDYALPAESFMKQVMNLIEQDKVEEPSRSVVQTKRNLSHMSLNVCLKNQIAMITR